MKKLLTILLTVVMAFGTFGLFTGCAGGNDGPEEVVVPTLNGEFFAQFDDLTIDSNFKLGVLCLHGETSTYDKNFIDAVKKAAKALKLKDNQVVIYTDIPEGDECRVKALELADLGCKAIFADSFGHEDYLIEAAQARPNVQFYHATGFKANSSNLPNYHNAFASIYEGRYLAGVAGGMKLKELIDAGKLKSQNYDSNGNVKVGYVGAWTYAEVVSGLSSWYLGVRSIVPNVVMDVQFTGSWYDEVLEREAANTLISRGCALISQHADSMGAPNACENAGIPNVSYNGSTINACEDTFIISSKIDWTYYFKWIIAYNGSNDTSVPAIPTDYTGTIKDSCMVVLTNLNKKVMAEGTLEKLLEVREGLMNGTIQVFDCSKFTVGGSALTSVEVNGQEVIKTENGITYFAESTVQSAPYFDKVIDGITFLNTKY